MSTLRQKIFTTVVLIAVVFAQVYGLKQGFACDHNGAVVETKAEHCHAAVADVGEKHIPCEKDCDGSQPQEQHAPVVTELTARNIAATVDAPEFVAVQLFDTFVDFWAAILPAAKAEISQRIALSPEGQKMPAAAVQVARTVVLLV